MLLKLISGLNNRNNRFQAASQLAAYFDCSFLMILIIDPEIGVLLPAPGFPQTLPDGKAWQDFTTQSSVKNYHSGSLPFFQDNNTLLSAVGISGPENSVAILLGGLPSEEKVTPLKEIMPILVSLFISEQSYQIAETRVTLADKSAAKAKKLAGTIDQMRSHLKDALIKQDKDKKDIEELMKKKDEFMNVASHELKTPVTTVKAYLQILNKLLPPGSKTMEANFIGKANAQLGKLTALIDDLLNVTKIQAGQMIYCFADIALSELIDEVVSQVQLTTPKHSILVCGKIPVTVNGEKHRLEQVLINFLSNAIKYSPHADKVIVSTDLKDNKVKVSVKDFGIGIPSDLQPFVFDRFYRVQESSRQFSGLGLGLYISSEIIKRHNGYVGVESNEEGSEFFFTLPVVHI